MSDSWYLALIVVAAALVTFYFVDRRRRVRQHVVPPVAGPESKDFAGERNDLRHAAMDADDREWELASQRRSQESQERKRVAAGDPAVAGSVGPDA